MQAAWRDGIGSPVVLVPLSLLVAAGSGAAALLLGLPARAALLSAVLVPWALSAAAGVAVAIAAARSQRSQAQPPRSRPPAPREPARSEQLVVDLSAWPIDLRDQPSLDLPRQQSRERP
jgi:hypothetical protein